MPKYKNPHGQYFTPAGVAKMMVTLIRAPEIAPVLEPCSGEGVFLDELLLAGFSNVTAVEIDSTLADACSHAVVCKSFINWRPGRHFSTIIGNPPYIRWRDLDEVSRREVRGHPLYQELFNSLSDYLTVFIASGIELLEEGGELIFITPSFWMHTSHSAPLREWMLTRGAITDIVDFGETRVFDDVSSAIVVFRFEKGAAPTGANYYRYVGDKGLPEGDITLDDADLFVHQHIPAFNPKEHWGLASSAEMAGAKVLEDKCRHTAAGVADEIRRLGEFVDIANGMVSGLDKAFRIDEALLSALNARELKATFGVLKAANIKPLSSGNITRYINLPQGLSETQVRSRYPHFFKHLKVHQPALEKRYSYQRTIPFWEWSFRRSEKFFLNGKEKGFVPSKERLTNRSEARFTLSESGVVAVQDVTAFAPKSDVRESVLYMVAYLSQPIVTEWIKLRGFMRGGVAEFSERPLASIPFRAIDWNSPVERAVHQRVVNLMKQHPKASTARRNQLEKLLRKEFLKLID